MKEKEIAQELSKLFFLMRHETAPQGNRKTGMGHRDIMILNGIHDLGKDDMVKMSAISEFFHITPAAVSQCIRNFEHEGWVERVILDSDRRSVYVKVTKKAKQVMKVCQDEMWKNLLAYIHFLGEEDSEQLLRIMDRTVAFFKEKSKTEKP